MVLSRLTISLTLGMFLLIAVSADGANESIDAVTKAGEDRKLSFVVPGKVIKVYVEEGDTVNAGESLLELEDEETKATIALYRMIADSDVSIQIAKKQLEEAEEEANRLHDLYLRKSGSEREYKRAKLVAEIRKLEVEVQKLNRDQAKHQLTGAEARHARRVLKAPIAGVVQEIIVSEGETVQALNPVLHLVALDRLKVDVPVPTAQTDELKVGDAVWIALKDAQGVSPMEGKITFVAEVADAASDTCVVKVELPNNQSQKAGRHVKVYFAQPVGLASGLRRGKGQKVEEAGRRGAFKEIKGPRVERAVKVRDEPV